MRFIGNDVMYFSYVLSKGTLRIDEIPAFNNLGIEEPVSYLNQLTLETAGIDLYEPKIGFLRRKRRRKRISKNDRKCEREICSDQLQ